MKLLRAGLLLLAMLQGAVVFAQRIMLDPDKLVQSLIWVELTGQFTDALQSGETSMEAQEKNKAIAKQAMQDAFGPSVTGPIAKPFSPSAMSEDERAMHQQIVSMLSDSTRPGAQMVKMQFESKLDWDKNFSLFAARDAELERQSASLLDFGARVGLQAQFGLARNQALLAWAHAQEEEANARAQLNAERMQSVREDINREAAAAAVISAQR